MEYILKLAIGDSEACPKGGRPEYRNGPQYERSLGKEQGAKMRDENKGACGWGVAKDEATRYTTIEQKVSNVRTWYDEALKNSSIANPARNPRIKRMLKSLEKRLGRTRKHVPMGLKKQILKDVLENIDLENTEEVIMGAYMGSNVLHGRRAIDQFFLDWANVTWHDAYEALQCESDVSAPAAASAGGGGSSGDGGSSGEAAREETPASGDASDQARGESNEQQRSQQPGRMRGQCESDASAAAAAATSGGGGDGGSSSRREAASEQVQGGSSEHEQVLGSSSEQQRSQEPGRRRGLGMHHQTTKNNRPQLEKGPKPLDCVTGCDGTVKRTEDGRLVFASFCPVHLLLHAKTLQARDAGVPVSQLRGPVFGRYKKIEKLPAGSTLVMSAEGSQAHKAPPLVMCVTRAQETAGLFYNRTVPFVVNGKAYMPPCRGVYFEVGNEGYAVHAWATADGVTHRMRQLMRVVNRRAGGAGALIPEETIQKLSSKSHRIAMATLLLKSGVPPSEKSVPRQAAVPRIQPTPHPRLP
jgi:hypothetical protein